MKQSKTSFVYTEQFWKNAFSRLQYNKGENFLGANNDFLSYSQLLASLVHVYKMSFQIHLIRKVLPTVEARGRSFTTQEGKELRFQKWDQDFAISWLLQLPAFIQVPVDSLIRVRKWNIDCLHNYGFHWFVLKSLHLANKAMPFHNQNRS